MKCIFYFLCLWFRASLIYINNCPMRRNTKQSIYYSASSLYMFWVSTTPIIRSTQNCNCSLRIIFFVLPSLTTLEGGSCTVPEAVVTVLCAPDGCGWHPKHVEWTCRIINRLLCVASRWRIIDIVYFTIYTGLALSGSLYVVFFYIWNLQNTYNPKCANHTA